MKLVSAGADGLVLFNWFNQSDIDVVRENLQRTRTEPVEPNAAAAPLDSGAPRSGARFPGSDDRRLYP